LPTGAKVVVIFYAEYPPQPGKVASLTLSLYNGDIIIYSKSMAKVYFSQDIETILNQIDLSRLGKKVGIKVHFGEKGCNTYLDPALAQKVYEKIVATGREAALVECNVLYQGSRTNRADHLRTAQEHGFDCPIDILDGELGQDSTDLDGCQVGAGLLNYDSLVVLSHFKGHEFAGFGGAIKNVGMGLGSRQGKLDMHSTVKPSVNTENCIGCGVCASHCDVAAISLATGKAEIDNNKCVGCAMCIAVCPVNAVSIPWGSRTTEDLQKRIAEYAAAILKHLPNSIFINVLQKITPQCDCMDINQEPLMDDVGILASDDIVSIEQASLDLANEHSHGKFAKINPVDKAKQIELAEKLQLGESRYELIKI
jgi:uncharacterized protein